MRIALKRPIVFAMAIFLVGCATRSFVRPAPDTFTLGKTTYSQVIEKMGKPEEERVQSHMKGMQALTLKRIDYAMGPIGEEPFEALVIPQRFLVYFFHNDTLVGEIANSTFKSDHTNFDETKASSLVKGQTARAQVIQLLGQPSGRFIQPMSKDNSVESLVYSIGIVRHKARLLGPSTLEKLTKQLVISFDDRGVVADFALKVTNDSK